jgi:hypothetical protein
MASLYVSHDTDAISGNDFQTNVVKYLGSIWVREINLLKGDIPPSTRYGAGPESKTMGWVYVQGHGNIYRVVPGTPLPGLGAVEQIKRQNGRWVVMTPQGIIALMRDPESDDEDTFDGD